MIVAEQVAAALRGELVTNAVNIPTVGADDLEVLGPYIPLAAKLGRLAAQLAGGDMRRVLVEAEGDLAEYDTRLLTVAALNGAFQGRTRPAGQLRERADRRCRSRRRGGRGDAPLSHDYKNLVAVSADGRRVAGTTIGTEDRQWLVSALGFQVEIELAPRMALLRYDDVPGVIGRVGTLFGNAGVNIANMAVSRSRDAGKALMALSIDSPVPPELIARLREGTDEAHVIQ